MHFLEIIFNHEGKHKFNHREAVLMATLLFQYDASIQRMYIFEYKMQLGSDSSLNLSKIFPSKA